MKLLNSSNSSTAGCWTCVRMGPVLGWVLVKDDSLSKVCTLEPWADLAVICVFDCVCDLNRVEHNHTPLLAQPSWLITFLPISYPVYNYIYNNINVIHLLVYQENSQHWFGSELLPLWEDISVTPTLVYLLCCLWGRFDVSVCLLPYHALTKYMHTEIWSSHLLNDLHAGRTPVGCSNKRSHSWNPNVNQFVSSTHTHKAQNTQVAILERH